MFCVLDSRCTVCPETYEQQRNRLGADSWLKIFFIIVIVIYSIYYKQQRANRPLTCCNIQQCFIAKFRRNFVIFLKSKLNNRQGKLYFCSLPLFYHGDKRISRRDYIIQTGIGCLYNCGLTVRNKGICYVMLCYEEREPKTRPI